MIAPLLTIRPLPQAVLDLDGVSALAFTSVNGVTAFAALTDRRDLPVFTVGDATAEAARKAGFRDVTSADGAIADLAALLDAHAPPGLVLAPGAKAPAGNLALLVGRARVRPLPVYEAVETGVVAPSRLDAILLQSPRAARALAALSPALPPPPIIAQSSAIADAASPLRVARVAARPTEDALLEALGNAPPAV